MRRGGRPELETLHGKLLLAGGEEEIWGWGTPAGRERVRRRVAWLTATCDLGPGVRVLECGCGTGLFTRELIRTGAHVTAMDISPDLLSRARQACPHPGATFVEGNLEAPPALPKADFDVLCGISVLHHLEVPRMLQAVRGFLKPGARFAFSEPNLLNPINKYYLFVPDAEKRRRRGVSPSEMAFTPDELRRLFVEGGYQVDSLELRDFLHPAIPRWAIPLAKFGQALAEAMPLVRSISGSIWISGQAPR